MDAAEGAISQLLPRWPLPGDPPGGRGHCYIADARLVRAPIAEARHAVIAYLNFELIDRDRFARAPARRIV